MRRLLVIVAPAGRRRGRRRASRRRRLAATDAASLHGRARQRVRPGRGRRREGRRRARRQHHRHASSTAQTKRALVDIEIDRRGFGDLRTDAFCETRPQSLIGEYFVDCQPGTAAERLETGGDDPGRADRLDDPARPRQQHHAPPVPRAAARSSSTSSAPASPAAASDLNETIRRAVPALRETDRVLAILAEQNQVLARPHDATPTRVVARPRRQPQGRRPLRRRGARHRRRLGRAARRHRAPACARLPGLPARAAADDGRSSARPPTRRRRRCADLDAVAPASSRRCFEQLGPFADASRTGVKSLAERPRTAGRALPARGRRSPSSTGSRRTCPSSRNNLAIVLEHLDDRELRRREGPALARRQGLHGLRGAPPVRLRPDAGDQHLRRQRLHAEGRTSFLSECSDYQSLAVAEGEAAAGPRLLPALRRDPRPEPARHHAARPDLHRRAEGAPSATRRRARKSAGRAPAEGAATPRRAQAHRRGRAGAPSSSPSSSRSTLGIELPDAPAGAEIPALPIRAAHGLAPAGQQPPRERAGAPRLPARAMNAAPAVSPTRCWSARSPCWSRSSPSSSPTTPTTACRSCRPRPQGARRQRRQPGQGQRGALGRLRIGVVDDIGRSGSTDGSDRRRARRSSSTRRTATSRGTRTLRIRPRSALGLKYVELTRHEPTKFRRRRHGAVRRRRASRPSSTRSTRSSTRRRATRPGEPAAASATRSRAAGGRRPHARGAAAPARARSSR